MTDLTKVIEEAQRKLEQDAMAHIDVVIPALTPKPGNKSPVWTYYNQARNRAIEFTTDRLDFERALLEALASAQKSIATLTDEANKMGAIEQSNTELADKLGRAEVEIARLRGIISKMTQERSSLGPLYAACDVVIADFFMSTGLRPTFSGEPELDAEGKHLIRKLRFGHYEVTVIPNRGIFTISAPDMVEQSVAIANGVTPEGNLALFGFLHFEALNPQEREALPMRLKQAYYTAYAEEPTPKPAPQPEPVSDDIPDPDGSEEG